MSPQGVFRVMLRMQIKSGVEADFERVWLAVGESITSHPANFGQWLFRSVEEPAVYYIFSDWADEPSFREFEKSERHLVHRQKLHPFRSGGSMAIMQTVAHLPGLATTATHQDWEAAR